VEVVAEVAAKLDVFKAVNGAIEEAGKAEDADSETCCFHCGDSQGNGGDCRNANLKICWKPYSVSVPRAEVDSRAAEP
jgi:hypothetical protein